MAEQPIRKEDIIDIEGLREELKLLIGDLTQLANLMKGDLSKSAAEFKQETEKIDVTTKEGRQAMKDRMKDITDITKQYNALNKAVDSLNKDLKQVPAIGSYNELNNRLKELRNLFKSTADEGVRNGLVPRIKELDAQLKKLDSTIGNNQRNVGNYSGSLKELGSKFLAFTGISVSVGAAFKFIKSAFESTNASGDRLEEMTEGVKQGFNAIKRAVINLDFKDFIKNVKEAYQEGERYAKGLDEVDEKTRALKVLEADYERQKLESLIKSRSAKTKEEQVKYGKEVIDIEEKLAGVRTGIAERAFQNEIDNIVQITGLHVDEVMSLLRMQPAILANIESGKKYNDMVAERARIEKQLTGQNSVLADVDRYNELDKAIKNTTSETIRYAHAAKNLATDEKMQVLTDKYVDLQNAKNSALQNTIRTQTQTANKENRLAEDSIKREKDTIKEIDFVKNKSASYNPVLALKLNKDLTDIKLKSIEEQKVGVQDFTDFEKELAKEVSDEKMRKWTEDANRYIGIASDITQQFTSILAERKKKELSAVGDNAAAREKIEKEYAKKEKALAITNAIIQNATNILKALGTFPVPNIPLAAITGALGAVQIGMIASQKFAEGGYTGDGVQRDDTGERVAGVVHEKEYVIPKEPTRKYRDLLEAIHQDNPMAIAEELRSRQFHTVWGGIQPKLAEVQRQDPYTRMMYDLMKNSVVTYEDTNGDTVLRFADGSTRIIRK